MTEKATEDHPTGDDHMGAVEGDTASDKQQGNENAIAVNEQGLPDPVAICEDVIGANEDGSAGG